jgi:hypothetical protein
LAGSADLRGFAKGFHGLHATGNHEYAAGVVSVYATPRGGDQKVYGAISINVPHADGIEAESVAGNA